MRSIFFLSLLFLCIPSAYAAPHILVTIKPIHALISGVTEGVTEPELLIEENTSPNTYSFNRQDAKKLQEADIVFLVSRHLERFLARPLKTNHKTKATVIELIKTPGMTILPVRENNLWGEATEETGEGRNYAEGKSDPYDSHIWLDPDNAIKIVTEAREVLCDKDPENAVAYRENAEKMIAEIRKLDMELTRKLAPYGGVPYMLFQDNYRYFEAHYHLNPLGVISLNLHKKPNDTTIKKLQETVARHNVICLFSEPGTLPEAVEIISQATDAGVGTLDAVWGTEEKSKEAYFILMRNMSNELIGCFDKKRNLIS